MSKRLVCFITENKIEIAIIAVPEIAAQEVCDRLVAAGIRGILNFAPIQLKKPTTCIVSYVNLEVELENLIYFVNEAKQNNGTLPDASVPLLLPDDDVE